VASPLRLQLTTILKIDALAQQFTVTNTDDHSFSFSALLHTYFKVSSIGSTTITGLKGADYIDQTSHNQNPTLKV